MATLTRYTAKFYKDSTKTFYAVFIASQDNPITRVQESTGKYSYSSSVENLPDGSSRHTLVFSKTTSGSDVLLFDLEFKDRSQVKTSGQVPSDSQILVAAHDSLSFFTTFSDFDSDSSSYSISDSIYYSKSPYNILYVYPTSSVDYLDTSSSKDSYYATAGGAAYVASNDLQNSFLIGRSYSIPKINSNQLGRFAAGKGGQTLNFSQYTDVTQVGPVVHGHTYVDSQVIPGASNIFNVSMNAASSNYYLNGCIDKELPCRNDGTTFSNDCKTGVTLTSAVLNDSSNIFQDGKCAASCDGYALKVMNSGSASNLVTADGTLRVIVENGTADYTYSLAATNIGVGLSFTTVNGTSTTENINFTSLFAGEYLLIVTDASSPTCQLRQRVYVESVSGESTLKGCLQSSAINYDSSVAAANGWDSTCVYCNSTGKLVKGSNDEAGIPVGYFATTSSSVSAATSIATTGAAVTNGRVIISKLKYGNYTIQRYSDPYSNETVEIQFNAGDYFTGGTDYEYKLYSLKGLPSQQYYSSDYLVANGTLVETKTNTTGNLMSFTDLAANDYAVRIAYTKDGAAEEYEDCYIIEQFSVGQQGCTDTTASNYNPDANQDDGSCRTPDDPGEDCNLELGQYLFFNCQTPVYSLVLAINHDLFPSAVSLVAAAGITDPGGNSANPLHCYYAIVIHYVDGSNETLQDSSMNFYKLWNGTVVGSWNCKEDMLSMTNISSVQLYFSHGGPWAPYWPPETDYPVYVNGQVSNQGNCGYSEFSSVVPYYDNIDNCCIVEPDPITGCMDNSANNYNPDATIDDGSCTYDPILGCTDAAANNYNPAADTDDGSCLYDVYGCMDTAANNYDATATIDNGSCSYDETPCSLLENALLSDSASADVFTTSIVSTTSTYDIPTQTCVPNSDGVITVTLPTALIQAAGVNAAYWTVTLGNVSSNLYYGLNWTGTVSANDALANMQNASLVIADGELLPIGDQYEFTDLAPGAYTALISIHTNISADGLSVISTGSTFNSSFCTTVQHMFNVPAGNCDGQDQFIMGCTDSNAVNYNAAATDDDGTCSYSEDAGCTDIFAVNYNPNVIVDDGSCNYQGNACAPPVIGTCTPNLYTENSADAVSSCCIPTDISDRLDSIEKCLANSGSRFYNKMITGLSDSCSTMDAWKMMIILEILRKKGLPCVYNCSDAATQSLTGTTCNSVWVTQGSPIWTSSATYQIGHVVKSNVDINAGSLNKYYVATTGEGLEQSPNTTVNNSDNNTSGWQRCCDEVTYSGNINYLTNFISFAEKYCQDCELPSQLQESPITIEVISNLSVGGVNIKNNGGSFEAS